MPSKISPLWSDFGDALVDIPHNVEFLVEGQLFRGHKFVFAAQSNFFKTLLSGGFREAKITGEPIPIHNCTRLQFQALMGWLYMRTFPVLSLEVLMSLLPLAEYFQCESLQSGVESRFREMTSIHGRNVNQMCALASQGGFEGLRENLTKFLCANYDMIPLEEFIKLPQQNLFDALNSGMLDQDEEVIFDRVIRWGYAKLGRPQPESTLNVRIGSDEELRKLLEPLLPPSTLFSIRNKKTLLGANVFNLAELV